MLTFRLSKFIVLLLLISSSWVHATDVSFSRIFVFGDSLSDTGNFASLTGELPSPFYRNRISNGPVAVEILAARLGHTVPASLHLLGPAEGSNYAVAGANAAGMEPMDLDIQIVSFQANHIVAPADALYVIFVGGNDVRDARSATNSILARAKVKAAAAKVRKAIQTLSRAGARSFLLVSAPNIGQMPETRRIAATTNDPGLIERSRKLSKMYQDELYKMTRYLKYTSRAKITRFDLFDFFNELVADADSYGFSNTTEACFNSADATFHPDCDAGSNFDAFVFFDEIHPTARVHELVGEAFYDAINSAKTTEVGWYAYLTNIYSTYTSFQGR
ncbi:MAG: SGNH/GDSL hydrolase family protein [Gammaproteobacteria bacterium]|nr:SGNH/GDSL hydrolase family protein [Gammaproteobacteria bacterium]